MSGVEALIVAPSSSRLNVTDRLARIAKLMPEAAAIACPHRASPRYQATQRGKSGAVYSTTTFAELEADVSRIARGLTAWGVPTGTRLALLLRPGIEFVTLVFALLRAGMVIVLVDPGLGRQNLIRCLTDAQPEGFVAIPVAQAARLCLRRKFPRARWNVTIGRRWFWGGITSADLRRLGDEIPSGSADSLLAPRSSLPATCPDDPAAIIFTSGSTGPPKGVLYTQQMFDTQVAEIQAMYGIEPGGVDLACFPLFALFNAAMGVTTVFPDMEFSRPASADPKKLLEAANDWRVTQAFASPAVWRNVGDHCELTGDRINSLRQVFSCGAPVNAHVIRKTLGCVAPDAKMHTPYGATECLPVSTIEAAEVLGETAARTGQGAGVCVGRKFDTIEWRIIRIIDEPITTIDEAEGLPAGEIGELIVRGPQVSREYVTCVEANASAKIESTEYGVQSAEGSGPSPLPTPHSPLSPWHRTGDVGYLDEHGRFWYCGRKSQRVESAAGPLFTECVEGVFNRHPEVELSAMVGVGRAGDQLPVIAVKFKPDLCALRHSGGELLADFSKLAATVIPASTICDWMVFEELPVDIRHNSKIDREFLRKSVVIGIMDDPKLIHPELVARARQSS
jgi:acyl-CoA synthetase (AMP-forming)/AMP-acid ligase II